MRSFQSLSSYDFECLVRDLLQAEWGERLESFSPGQDGGVDIRLLRSGVLRTVQCKHHADSTLSSLVSKFRKEASKVRGLKLGEYWVATSARATPAAKADVSAVFGSSTLPAHRILALEDLENLLNLHRDVERTHIKLYLSSLAVLEEVLHHELFERQRYFLERATSKIRYFVASQATTTVQSTLAQSGMCIVTGPPGIGKTTLAESIALGYARDGYEVFDVRSAGEIERVWRGGEKQLFLYDDFLGQTSLAEKLDRGEDHTLDVLASRVAESGTHRLILTTREYILTSARSTYSKLQQPRIMASEVVVDINSYSNFQRAHILFNHVYFSLLGSYARESLQSGKTYRTVIDHANYNPRLIESVISAALALGGKASQGGFAEFMIQALENPGDLWRGIFNVELTPTQRVVAIVAGVESRQTAWPDVIEVAQSMLRAQGQGIAIGDDDLDVLEGIFLRVDVDAQGAVTVGPKNPSIRDFLLERMLLRRGLFGSYLDSARDSSVDRTIPLVSAKHGSSRAWANVPAPEKTRALLELSQSIDRLFARVTDHDTSVSIARNVIAALEQLQGGVPSGVVRAAHRELVKRYPSCTDISSAVAAFWKMDPYLTRSQSTTLANSLREAWSEETDMSQLPAAIDFEREIESGLDGEIELWVIDQVEYAMGNYSRLYNTESEMLYVVQDLVAGLEVEDSGGLLERIEERLREVWEPDEDEDDDGRIREGHGSVDDSDIDSLFVHLRP